MIANDFLLLARPYGVRRLAEQTEGVGLAAARLAEVICDDYAAIRGDKVVLRSGVEPADGLEAELLTAIREVPASEPVNKWLKYLARDAVSRVEARMVASGLLRPERVGLLLRKRQVPIDVNLPASVGVRLGRQPLTQEDVVLACLVRATPLGQTIAGINNQYLSDMRDALPFDLRTLIEEAEIMAGDNLYSHLI